MRGLKLLCPLAQVIGDPRGRAIRPAYEGIETGPYKVTQAPCSNRCVARSAPLMRGLKPGGQESNNRCPKNQVARSAPLMRGLKLDEPQRRQRELHVIGRAIRPAYEGIETLPQKRFHPATPIRVARSAPLMRGLKPCEQRCFLGRAGILPSRDPPRL